MFTIASKNYLAQARVLARSWHDHNPGSDVFLCLVDQFDGWFDPATEPFKLLTVDQLPNVPSLREFLFKYNIIEANTAVKPFVFDHLLGGLGYDQVTYLDPDIWVASSLDEVWTALEHSPVALTPHMLAPLADQRRPTELDVLQAGTYNLGFVALKKAPEVQSFLDWWKKRLYDQCIMDPARGLHVDQRWMEYAPSFLANAAILRNPALNVAYWNLHERGSGLEFSDGKATVHGKPLRFFHFSGFLPERLDLISKHQDRFTLEDWPNLRPLFARYRDLLYAEGFREVSTWPYAYGSFRTGEPIPNEARQLFRERFAGTRTFADPFASGPESFLDWLRSPPTTGAAPRVWLEVHGRREDLRASYPDPTGRDRAAFRAWVTTSGTIEYPVVARIVSPPVNNSAGRKRPVVPQIVGAAAGLARRIARDDPRSMRRFAAAYRVSQALVRRASGRPRDTRGSSYRARPFGANLLGYFSGEFGVAEAGRAMVRAVRAAGISHELTSVGTAAHRHEDRSLGAVGSVPRAPYRFNVVNVNADEAPLVLENLPAFREGQFSIGVWYWELSRFPEKWRSSFRPFQEIWAASAFTAQAIAAASPVPVVRMPYAVTVDNGAAAPNRRRFGIPEEKPCFLVTFDFRSIVERKNPAAAIDAFRAAFGTGSDAILIVKTINSQSAPQATRALHDRTKGLNVHLFHDHVDGPGMVALMSSADCYVSLHRSEGFGIGMAHSMYLGKPVIATGYAGNMDYMNVDNALLVRHSMVELDHDYGPYEKGNEWAEPSVDHAAEWMRWVVEKPEHAASLGRRARHHIHAHFSPERAGQAVLERLRRLSEL